MADVLKQCSSSFRIPFCDRLLTGVVDLNLLIDGTQDCLHFIFQAIQLPGFALQYPLVFFVVFLELCECTSKPD